MRRAALTILGLLTFTSAVAAPRSLTFGRFGTVSLFGEGADFKRVAVYVSGDNGWTAADERASQELAAQGALVIGVNGGHYRAAVKSRKEACAYPAADFEELSQFVQKELKLSTYRPPVLIGRSEGATLVYATLAQAPTNTFAGAVSLGFCPIYAGKSFCKGQGLMQSLLPDGRVMLAPVKTLESPWIAFEGSEDAVCSEKDVETFAKQVFHGDIVLLPGAGHDFADTAPWLTQLKEAVARAGDGIDVTPPSGDVSTKGLPLVEVRAKGEPKNILAVIISGDGGWAGIDRELSKTLSEEGVDVVGLNSLKYFWKRRTPDEGGKDLERLVRHYLAAWNHKSVILIGYSRGADVMPFMANRLPEDLLKKTPLIALLGLEKSVDFEIHPGDIFDIKWKDELPVKPEVEKLKGQRIACFAGIEETDSLCHDLPADLVNKVVLKGGHHFGGAYKQLAQDILSRAK